jgi:hypothetical protein
MNVPVLIDPLYNVYCVCLNGLEYSGVFSEAKTELSPCAIFIHLSTFICRGSLFVPE